MEMLPTLRQLTRENSVAAVLTGMLVLLRDDAAVNNQISSGELADEIEGVMEKHGATVKFKWHTICAGVMTIG